jgi:branched-chain amino acid transport system ATP-binding protein
MTASPILHATGVTVRFGGVVAVDNVDFAVPPAGVVGLVGPNGAGKTTLFEVISGFRRPSTGSVLLAGADVTGASPQRRARLGLARTFQRMELFGELTVAEHVLLAHRARHRRLPLLGLLKGSAPSAPERAAVTEILDVLGLCDLADEPAAALPLGAGRLVEVARALATGPQVILLDEPSSGLDDIETERLVDTLMAMHADRDIALILVEHNLGLVLRICDSVHVLDFGRTVMHGPPAEVRADPRVQAAYIGTPTEHSATDREVSA